MPTLRSGKTTAGAAAGTATGAAVLASTARTALAVGAQQAGPTWVMTTLMPTLISILVIVGVSLASEYSSLAAAIATAPTGTPLSIWVFVQHHPNNQKAALKEYTLAVVKGVLATLVFAIASWGAARAELGMVRVLASGYASWFLAWLALSKV